VVVLADFIRRVNARRWVIAVEGDVPEVVDGATADAEYRAKVEAVNAGTSGLTVELIDKADAICETVKSAHGIWLGISRVGFLLKELQAEPANEAASQL